MTTNYNYRSLGIHGVAGKLEIPGDAVVVEQYVRPDGKFQLDIAMTNLDELSIEEGAQLEVVIKDNSIAFRREYVIGEWARIDRTRVEITLERELKPSRTQVFLNIIDPRDAKLLAATEELRIRDDGPAGHQGGSGSSASFIKFVVTDKQLLPVQVLVDRPEPTISFGTLGPNSVLESRSDFGFVGYALPGAIEKFVFTALSQKEDKLRSPQWDAFKDRMAVLARYEDWADMKRHVTDLEEILTAAQQCAEAFMSRGRLKHTLHHLHKIATGTDGETL